MTTAPPQDSAALTREERIRANAQVGDFELSAEDMAWLDDLGSGS